MPTASEQLPHTLVGGDQTCRYRGSKKKIHGFGVAGNYQWNLSKSPTLPNTAGKNSHA